MYVEKCVVRWVTIACVQKRVRLEMIVLMTREERLRTEGTMQQPEDTPNFGRSLGFSSRVAPAAVLEHKQIHIPGEDYLVHHRFLRRAAVGRLSVAVLVTRRACTLRLRRFEMIVQDTSLQSVFYNATPTSHPSVI